MTTLKSNYKNLEPGETMPKIGQVVKKEILPKVDFRNGWEEDTAKLNLNDGEEKVNGYRMGYLIITKDYHKGSQVWIIGHTLTGNPIVGLIKSESEAFKIGNFLWDNLCLILRKRTVEEIRESSPEWIKGWIEEIQKKGGWVDPENYCKSINTKITFKRSNQ